MPAGKTCCARRTPTSSRRRAQPPSAWPCSGRCASTRLEEASDLNALESLHDTVTQARRQALQACADFIDTHAQLNEAAQQVRRLMFIERFLRDIEQRLDQMP